MPVNKNPKELKIGSGRQVPESITKKIILQGSGMAGAGPNIGQPGYENPVGGVVDLPEWVKFQLGSLFSNSDTYLVEASSISITDYPSILISNNVEGALGELIGTVPPEPPLLGEMSSWTSFTSITDWGSLKLTDGSLIDRGLLVTSNEASDIFPYYYNPPSPALQDLPFVNFESDLYFSPEVGNDPDVDYIFNSGLSIAGSGQGESFSGAFTRDGTGTDDEVIRTTRIVARSNVIDGGTGLPERLEVIISGSIYPADRGVLALIHWPAGTEGGGPATEVEFLAQPILDRCIAATLLGQGITNAGAIPICGEILIDGSSGGIFEIGRDESNHYNPFSFPGRATGQYDLSEIHNGIDNLDGNPLKEPFDDLNDTGGAGAQRDQNGTVAAAGQVRLGTNPTAGVPALEYGIPILGGTNAAYSPAVAALAQGHIVLGNTVLEISGGDEPNFFRYRLPYLKDYSVNGLKWTPKGTDPTSTRETFRYYEKASPSTATLRDGTPISVLPTAGNYEQSFNEDYWVWQIARYRHTFMAPSTAGVGIKEEVGSYWLIHFKRERDFEALVRDGILPWDATNGYETYGMSIVDTSNIEADGNIVNEETLLTVQAPSGPAPDYGYAADSYHVLRSSILQDPGTPLPSFTSDFDWQVTNSLGASEWVTFISGVAYFTPRKITDGTLNFEISDVNIDSDAAGFWDASYRTSDFQLTSGSTAPALISSPNPAFIGMAPFAYGDHPSNGTGLSADVPTGIPGAGLTETGHVHRHRVELPYTHCGSNGSGFFGEANGPAEGDQVNIDLFGGNIVLRGDDSEPSFSIDSRLRSYFRRPLGHATVDNSSLPFSSSDGHGINVPSSDGAQILLHTTRWDDTNNIGEYGNFTTALGGPFPSPGEDSLFTSSKDTEERFLDETYRWTAFFNTGIDTLYSSTATAALNGPGMQGYVGGPIETPVRIGIAAANWDTSSWLQGGHHLSALNSAVVREGLQVQGLPERNPPLSDGATVPFPSSGVLTYPIKDYTAANIRPKGSLSAGTDFTGDQPDYTGTSGLLTYVRAFDAAFSRSGNVVEAENQPFVIFRLDGVILSDFSYSAPGPGQQENNALALQMKIPGLTTWMDMGRPDGEGPSKQDPNLDGAGCKLIGPETFNGVDPITGMVYCQVKVNAGPIATLFRNLSGVGGNYQDTGATSPIGEVPVLIKVSMKETAVDYNLEREYDGSTFIGVQSPGISSSDIRGLTGIRVIRNES